MPKVNLIQNNFTAGELSPRMYGRMDVQRYNNGAKRIENCVVLIHGGCLRRPGTEYMVAAKHADKLHVLIPYVFNVDQAYQLEIGDVYMRFLTAAGEQIESTPGTPYEIAAPWSEAQLREIAWCHRADTMFLFHPDVPTQRLQRFGDADWRLMAVPWVTEPFDELGDRPAADLTLSDASVGAGRTVTASAGVFLVGDVGREIEAGGGIGLITGFTSATQVTVTISHAFADTAIASGDWLLTASPQTTLTPSGEGPVGTAITLSASAASFRAGDVGKHVVLNGGLVKITGFTSSILVSAQIRVEMAAAVAVVPNAWALCRSMWGQEFGYPRTGSLYQQRLWLGGSPGFPQSAWMSRLAEYYDFEIGTTAGAAFETRIDADQANPIRHMAAARALAVLSYGAEFTLRPAGDGGVKPGNIDVDPQSAFGCNGVQPKRLGNELLFVNPTGRKIRALSADRFDATNFAAPDITAAAEHITESGVVALDVQAEPEQLVWAVRADGVIALCTLDRDNEVVAWTRLITDGVFEGVSVAPNGTELVVLASVRRTVDGVVTRGIEKFRWDFFVDGGIEVTNAVAFDTVSGLPDHMEGKAVAVRIDGRTQADRPVVDGGQITLSRAANTAQVGLPFVPLVELMVPEVMGPTGSVQGLLMRCVEASILVKDTIGAMVNGRRMLFRRFGPNVLDQAPEPFNGMDRIEQLGYERGTSDITISQPDPEPFHLLAVVRKMEFNEG